MIELSVYLSDIYQLSDAEFSHREKMLQLKQVLERLSRELTRNEVLQFPNLFSRLVFISQKYHLPKQLEWQLQHFRVREKAIRKNSKIEVTPTEYRKAERALLNLCRFLQGDEVAEEITPESDATSNETVSDSIRVHLLRIDANKKELICIAENAPDKELTVKYDVSPHNSAFNESVSRFWEGAQLNLIHSTLDKKGRLIPKQIVLEPDYLIDASAIAECFQDYAISPLHYFRNKFEEVENRSYLLLGNLANFFLDELIFAENPTNVSFDDVFLKSFKQSPFEYTTCEDIRSNDDFREFMQKANKQFKNIKRVIQEDFPLRRIDTNHCTLEPSFFSEKFGFQGRLDLLHIPPESTKAHIVELKSGRLPFPNYDKGKIALNHEVQTSVYRLMIESVFGKDSRNIDAAILYSAGDIPGENLRFAAVYQELEKEILNLRNLIVANEYRLMHGDNETVKELFEELYQSIQTTQRLPNFFIDKIVRFQQVLSRCNSLELSYFYRYIRFISRELYLQKIGDIDYETPTGIAALWNSDFSERADALDVLYDLTIDSIDDSGNDMTILFSRNSDDNAIANFRDGEICIVYPRDSETQTVLNTQILKGNIVSVTPNKVEVRFRYKQKNRTYFTNNTLWAIEHDTLDSSYNSMYKSLFSFLSASQQKKNVLLGLDAPTAREINESEKSYPENIIDKALAANDYFLIVGPPGTGKTSIFARRLIEEYYSCPDKNILVIAYTNRAVDELCQAINAAFGCANSECDAYIRVGTELSCAEPYRHRLLQQISEKAKSREELRHEIMRTRIYVSTLASINGRQELFALKHFHVAIIDEASQILEPQIIGLLPRFDSFVMIGDHNQLSTIMLQKPVVSAVHEPKLTEIGMTDCGASLFERLLRRCIVNNWHHAYAQLTVQGRMHEKIAQFPATYFYTDGLLPATERQTREWKLTTDSDDVFHQTIATQRIAFFSTEKLYRPASSHKTNEQEADIVVRLAQSLREVYLANEIDFNTTSIGIIAPYRNQIALIKHKLSLANVPDYENILVDTVERFQGSQRDVIIISFCVSRTHQLHFLANMNHDGTVDRKLNVSLTRAREQLFLVGNPHILKNHPVYATLLEFYKNNLVVV